MELNVEDEYDVSIRQLRTLFLKILLQSKLNYTTINHSWSHEQYIHYVNVAVVDCMCDVNISVKTLMVFMCMYCSPMGGTLSRLFSLKSMASCTAEVRLTTR